MRVQKMQLADFIGWEHAFFSIPMFQRSYSWDVWQCEELWRDITVTAQENGTHFVGAVLYLLCETQEDVTEVSLVDGQQRTATVFLLLSAFAQYLEESGEALFGMDAQAVKDTYLKSGDNWKFSPSQKDDHIFQQVLSGSEDETLAKTRAAKNRSMFLEKMREPGFDALAFWHGFLSLVIVAVELDEADNAQEVFESFNGKGVPLVTADLVRNYLLVSERPDEQKRLFDDYWGPIQGSFGDDPGSIRLNTAIRAWTIIRDHSIRVKGPSEVFDSFKRYVEDQYAGTLDDLLDELLGFCIVWAENYRYHAVKKYMGYKWNKIGRKTLVSDRKRVEVSEEKREYYRKHYGTQ